jgi:hypothetical protein
VPLQALRLISWPLVGLIALAVALLALSPVVATIALGACVAAALVGPSFALRALAVATLISYANPAIVKLSPLAAVLERLVLLAMIVRVLPLVRGADLRLIWPIWLFGALAAFTSFMTSPAFAISIMKVITFTLSSTAVIVAFGRVRTTKLPRLQTWFLTLWISVMMLSALTLLKPGVALGGDGGLQGLLSQPQALGIFIAPFAAWALTGVLLMRRQASRLEVWLAIASVALIVLTRARTGAFAALFAVAFVMLTHVLSGRRTRHHASLGRPMLIAAIAGLALIGAALATGKVGKFVTAFAYKDYSEAHRNLSGAFYESRGGGVVSEWNNFTHSPLMGNGFGVYPDGRFPSGVVMFQGIPISAPIEKGFLPTAILEEGGIVAAGGLVLLIVWLARRAWRTPELRWRAMFVACLAVNVGECVFLSAGGIGMLMWILLGVAISAGRVAALEARNAMLLASRGRTVPLESAPRGVVSPRAVIS